MSSDDVTINIWNLQDKKVSMAIVDNAPTKIENLNEMITHSEFSKLETF